MRIYIINGSVFIKNKIKKADLMIENGQIARIAPDLSECARADRGACVKDAAGLIVSPGFVDLHAHLREPGFCQKGDIMHETNAAARGGFTTVCSMPNLDPVPDCVQNLAYQLAAIRDKARVRVIPYGSVTKGEAGLEVSDIEELAGFCGGFSDDGKGVQNGQIMLAAMKRAAAVGSFIAAHCEDESLLFGGVVHNGIYAAAHGLKGISSASEYVQIERDIELAAQAGCRYHVCHISTAEGVEAVRRAKSRDLSVTCEVTPHHLALCEDDISCDDGRFKMNPPLRSRADTEALRQGLRDRTIDAIATDHAPHTAHEKSLGLNGSPFGVVGFETAFSAVYSRLVQTGIITLERMLEAMTEAPSKILGIPCGIYEGARADLTVIDPDSEYTVDPHEFLSKGKSSPFDGMKLFGTIEATVVNGAFVYER